MMFGLLDRSIFRASLQGMLAVILVICAIDFLLVYSTK